MDDDDKEMVLGDPTPLPSPVDDDLSWALDWIGLSASLGMIAAAIALAA
ncbi:hypothetical protein AB4Y85_11575 [Microvirga sp. 2YAF29]